MGKFEKDSLDALQRAVTKALDRKRRLGQYAVLWEENRMVLVGPDTPREQGLSRSRLPWGHLENRPFIRACHNLV